MAHSYTLHVISVSFENTDSDLKVAQYPLKLPFLVKNSVGTLNGACSNCHWKEPDGSVVKDVSCSVMSYCPMLVGNL